jgi:hypothetical protein
MLVIILSKVLDDYTEHRLHVDEMMDSHLLVIFGVSSLVVVDASLRRRDDDEVKQSFKQCLDTRNPRKQLTKIIRFSFYSTYNWTSSHSFTVSNIKLETRDVQFRARNRTSLSLHAFWVRVVYLRTTWREQEIRIVTDISLS